MKTVILYFVTCTRGYMADERGSGYSLRPWGNNTEYYEGDDDGGKHYELPEGYHIAESVSGEYKIYDPQNRYCDIIEHSSKLPQLISLATEMPILRRVS